MIHTEFIIVNDYCIGANIDPGFISLLEESGLIDIYIEEGKKYLPSSQLSDIEMYSRMYYDLSINIEGIDVIRHLLEKMETLKNEIELLRSRLSVYE